MVYIPLLLLTTHWTQILKWEWAYLGLGSLHLSSHPQGESSAHLWEPQAWLQKVLLSLNRVKMGMHKDPRFPWQPQMLLLSNQKWLCLALSSFLSKQNSFILLLYHPTKHILLAKLPPALKESFYPAVNKTYSWRHDKAVLTRPWRSPWKCHS